MASQRQGKTAPILLLQQASSGPLVHINTFGAFLRYLREREQLPRQELTATLPDYFEEHNAATFLISPDMYRKIEKGDRAPQYEELLPLYATLVGCGCKLTLQECSTFVRLARLKIEGLQRRRPKLRSAGEWRLLEIRLAQLGHPSETGANEAETSRMIEKRVRAKNILTFDTSHLVGRDPWLMRMLSYLEENLKKLVIIRGMMGVGKTSALKLLHQQFQGQELFYPIFYTFSQALDMTPGDHLHAFLATILAELDGAEPEAAKTVPLDALVEQVITRLAAVAQRVVLLVDDAQVILDNQGQLPQEWEQFLTAYLGADHQAICYLAAREWPFWLGRNRSCLLDGDDALFPTLDSSAGVQVWHQLGFTDVPVALLEQATKKCGGNPLLIELRAALSARPSFSFSWGRRARKAETPVSQKSEHQVLIESFLEEGPDGALSTIETQALLQQVISSRLSYVAIMLLEVLAISPIALPFPLLAEVTPQAEFAFSELQRNSLVDREAIASERAALLPLVREAMYATRRAHVDAVERQLISLYESWLFAPDFLSDQEQSAVVTELLALLVKHREMLKAAELVGTFGWLCTLFGQVPRLLRLFEHALQDSWWKAKPESDAGAILLRYQLMQRAGQKVDDQEQYRAYSKVQTFLTERQICLQPSTQVHLTHHLMLVPMRAGDFMRASALLEETFARISLENAFHPEDHASFLYSKARLLARWGEAEEKQGHGEEGTRLRAECIATRARSITLWQECQFGALPLQRRYIDFRLARSLNDSAYRLRLHGSLDEAERAMRDCLSLKREGAALPKSLAISLSEYSQLLCSRGKLEDALAQSDQALQIIDELIEGGNRAARADKGMILVERGEIYVLRGRLEEAACCFQQGRDLTAERAAREAYHDLALRRLTWVTSQQQGLVGGFYQFDRSTWFERYSTLAAYDELDWLLQAGPFTENERQEWDRLILLGQTEETRQRLSDLLVQSRQREFALCVEEEREPRLCYPKIPVQEVEQIAEGFRRLRADIEVNEGNVVVRQLYLDVIDEQLGVLRLVAAIASGNLDTIHRLNQALYGQPTVEEISIALQALFSMIEQAHDHALAAPFAEQIALQCKSWHLFAGDFAQARLPMPQLSGPAGAPKQETRAFSARTVQRFFQEVFTSDLPGSGIGVVIEPARGNTYVDVTVGQLALPDRAFSTEKVRQLLAEEVETHAHRGFAGRKSPLALLSLGLASYSATEEGIAKKYIEQVNAQIYGKLPQNSWPGTLAIGLMAGVVTPALSFRQLCRFLEQMFVIRDLLAGKYATVTEASRAASQEAWKRAARTARGVTDLTVPGICSLKDRVYLKGYLDVTRFLEKGGDLQRLYVGKVSLQHLEALREVAILQPSIPRTQLALDPQLQDRLIALEEA